MVDSIYKGTKKDDTAAASFSEMYGYRGNDTLSSNFGTTDIVPYVKLYGGKGMDTINYYGIGNVKMYGQGGADIIAGNAHDDVLLGGKGADHLTGNDGADRLKGGKGDDVLFGSLGNDWMKGGKGSDRFSFNTLPDTDLNKDVIDDFDPDHDFLHFNHTIFPGGYVAIGHVQQNIVRIGKKAKDDNDYFGYDKKTGMIWTDSNADEPGGFQEVADVGKDLAITYYHFFFD